jgi:serine/threonine protein kinase/predicted Zn-dependent protease
VQRCALKKLGKYEVIGELGHGAMGVVYRARDPVINRQVALKTITSGGADDPSMLERFYREAQSAGGLQHPNIVTIFDMGDESGVPYIAMELIDGENLDQLIAQRTPIPLPLKLVYATQACSAFDYAHKRGIIHRDIKPGNIMVNKDGTLKIVDFGIARVLEASKTQTGLLMGTFAYMSPEQYHGEHADERSDIWSFGVLLYELLSFQKPFAGSTPAALMHGICSQEPAPLRSLCPEVPEELEAVIGKLLQKSPDDRIQSMEDLLFRLDPICKSLQVASLAEMVARSCELVEQRDYSHARDLLRQALLIDSKNATARTLLEKVNTEIRRVTLRPKAQQQVDKGKALLDEGKFAEAKVAVDSALQMDSNFVPAQELRSLVQKEMERVQRVADWLDGAKQLIAEGMPEDAEALLAKVIDAEPANKRARALSEQALKQRAERERRLQLIEKMQTARSLWTQQKFTECIQLLTELQKRYPEEEDVSRLLQTAREDQAEETKKQKLDTARTLLAAHRYEECRSQLAELEKMFPNNQEISDLLQDLREDEAKQYRLKRIIQARNLLASRAFDECISFLSVLQKEYPGEDEVGKLLATAHRERLEESKKQQLAKARMFMASRQYQECNSVLEELRKQFPADEEIPKLLGAVVVEQQEQRKQEILAEARKLLAAHRHTECIVLLGSLQNDFPGQKDIESLLQTVHEDEAEQRKVQKLIEARQLVASGRFEESIALLTKLQQAFPDEPDIARLLETAQGEQGEQQKGQKIGEARTLFLAERFDDALEILEALNVSHPKDALVQKLQTAVLQEREKHAKEARLKTELAAVRKLVNEKKYHEVLARADKLLAEHPASADLARLVEFSRGQQAEMERELAICQALNEGRSLLQANRFNDAAREILDVLAAHPDHAELLALLDHVESQRRKFRARQEIEQRVKDIKVKINREKFSEAIALADETIATLGPDTDVTQLRKSAQVEIQAREKKRLQEQTIGNIRLLTQSGKFDDATRALDDAVSKKLFDSLDSRAQRAADEIAAARNTSKKEPSAPGAAIPGGFSKEYAFLQKTSEIDTPPAAENMTLMEAPDARASAAPQVAEPVQPKRPEQDLQPPSTASVVPETREQTPLVEHVEPSRPIEASKIAEPAETVKPSISSRAARSMPPVVPADIGKSEPPARPAPQHEARTSRSLVSETGEREHRKTPRKMNSVLTAVLTLVVILTAAGAYLLWPKHRTEVKIPSQVPTQRTASVAAPNPLEIKQREAINTAEKLVAANDLESALQTVTDAEKMGGPLTPKLQEMKVQIVDSIKDTRLRDIRQREAQLWQQAADKMKSKRYAEAQTYLRQLLALPEGGVHRNEAQTDLSDVIPSLQQQDKFSARVQQALRQGDFRSARNFASQVQRAGGDTSQLNGEIDKSETDRLVQLENQFRQLKEADDDSAVPPLRALQATFKTMVDSGGPKTVEAQSYLDNIATAISDVQTRAQNKRLEAAFQSAVQKYQQAVNATDKTALTAASGALQPFAQGGPHAGEAQKYLNEINVKLAAMNKPVTPPPAAPPANTPVVNTKPEAPPNRDADIASVRSVIQRYQQAFEQRDADALRQIWPSMGDRYKKYKQNFGAASAIQTQVTIADVKMGTDGASATVLATQTQEYSPKGGGKTMTSKDQAIFNLVKANGTWIITQIR